MNLSYPVTFKTYANGQVGAFFTDVPEAMTAGATAVEALAQAEDALVVALSGYLDAGRPLPRARRAATGQPVVTPTPRIALKLAIYAAMRDQGLTQAQLGERLHISGRQVRRILDLDHESRLSQLEAALAALGLRASVRVTKVAPGQARAAA